MTLPFVMVGQTIEIQFSIPLVVSPVSAVTVVTDENDLTVQAETPVAAGGLAPNVVTALIPGTVNAVPGLRVVRMSYVGPGDIAGAPMESLYRVGEQTLAIQVNSFATYNRLLDIASQMVDLTHLLAADRPARVMALAEAWGRIVKLRISEPTNLNRQDRLLDVPWAGSAIELDTLSAAEMEQLDPRLLLALRRAQVAEADSILDGGDQTALARKAGMVSNRVGESEQAYRLGKPLDLRISARAMRELGGFVSFSPRIGR